MTLAPSFPSSSARLELPWENLLVFPTLPLTVTVRMIRLCSAVISARVGFARVENSPIASAMNATTKL